MSVTLHQLLKTMVERGGSDLHIPTNTPPQIRIDGKPQVGAWVRIRMDFRDDKKSD
mgnify:CR=1 FL=1